MQINFPDKEVHEHKKGTLNYNIYFINIEKNMKAREFWLRTREVSQANNKLRVSEFASMLQNFHNVKTTSIEVQAQRVYDILTCVTLSK